MGTAIYISQTEIYALEGSGNGKSVDIKRMVKGIIPEKCITTGKITDEKAFAECVNKFFEENRLDKKDVHIVLGNNVVTTMKMDMPLQNEKKSYEYVRRELSKYGSGDQEVVAFESINVNHKANMTTVMASKLAYDTILQYQTLAKGAGIKISSVKSGLAGMIVMLEENQKIKNESEIVIVSEGEYITSLLYLNGRFNYSSSIKMSEAKGTVGYSIEVARSVSSILQFMKANNLGANSGNPNGNEEKREEKHDGEHETEDGAKQEAVGSVSLVKRVVLAGFDTEDALSCTDSIYQMNRDLDVSELAYEDVIDIPSDQLSGNGGYLYCAVGLLKRSRTQNLLIDTEAYKRSQRKKPANLKLIIPVSAVGALLGLTVIIMAVINTVIVSKTGEIERYNNSVSQTVAEYDALQAKMISMQTLLESVQGLRNNIDSYPVANEEVKVQISDAAAGYADAVIQSFDASTGVVSISTSSDNVENINRFIDRLRSGTIFANVNYTGYKYDENVKKWKINVVCILAKGAGREAAR